MKPSIRRIALAAAATAALTGIVQLPWIQPTSPSDALTGAGAVTELQITGRAGVPTNATAAVINLTALDSTTAGYVTAYPCGSALPNVSNLNYVPGGTAIANSATVPIGTSGKICLYTSSATNLIADINGWYPAGSDFTPTTPTRLLDTRPNRAGTGAVTELQITGRAGVPTNATAAVINLTALDSTTAGYVTAYPCGSALPNVSNLNYVPGGTAIANSATVPIGTSGKICLYTSSATNLIADINGWYPAGSDFTPTTPTRLLDTRPNRAGTGAVTELQITGRAGVPTNATAAVINLTALDSTTAGYVTAYPCGSALPNVSNLNYVPGGTAIANSATVPIGTSGKICLYTSSATNLIADINGWYPAGSDFTPTTPTRLLDTRSTVSTPSSAEFVATFDNNTGLEAFDTFVYQREGGSGEWVGDHDRSCGPPDPGRQIVVPYKAPGESVVTEEIYLCRDHLMTSMESVSSYSIVGFSPDQVFNRSESSVISWDVNVTDLGDRQWWEVVVIPAGTSHIVCHPSILDPCGADLIGAYPPGTAMFGIGPWAEFQVVGDQVNRYGGDKPCGASSPDPEGCASKAIRRQFTMTDNHNGTITIDYPAAGRSWTEQGSFPERFEVVFKDHSYTPQKDNDPVGFTWHWDNIVVR